MRIEKVLNNNVVITLTDTKEEMVVMGRGIAFQRKVGDMIVIDKIEKTFVPEGNEAIENYSTLFREIKPEIIEIASDAINHAQTILKTKLSDNIYLTLTDHLNYAIKRTSEGIEIKNPLTWEIKKFYKIEYDIGLKTIESIKTKLGVLMSEDEAASVALHIVNAKQDGQEIGITVKMTEVVQDILTIVRLQFGIVFNEESFNYSRFVTHLQYFARRMLEHGDKSSNDDFLFEQVKIKYPKAFECSNKINNYLENKHHTLLSKDEQVYLAIHIQRVTSEKIK
ncbi:transcriptional antiterminator, BglG family [Carnobacterium alterfunditum]|uniref:Transcriptional antiterminator, BglG family n=1 Tax=Carnobacterium alterfunditum TaxID=28230 RepID=A0A1N6FFN3_9LACT|nr:PRD domain-containing protein [Carnobacterium alterfunditum]SIN94006.1 transcriptional antiterminator, BglG family [Carnobacterium alterfunditum]